MRPVLQFWDRVYSIRFVKYTLVYLMKIVALSSENEDLLKIIFYTYKSEIRKDF